jgi:hypothetical protein
MKIVIVGGGPVGLTTAIKLTYGRRENLNNNYEIEIYEKRKKYTRNQVIVFGGSKGNLLFNYPFEIVKEIRKNIKCYIENPSDNLQGFCFAKKIKNLSSTIEIKKLENILKKFIKKNIKNIKIINKEFTNSDVKKYDIIIGADGAKSFVRDKVMKVKNHEIKDYSSYILQFIYTDLSNKKKTILTNNELFDYYDLKKKSNNNNNYNIDKKLLYLDQDRFRLIRYNDKKTQFLLQITKNNYNKIKNIKTFGKLPEKIKNSFFINSYIMDSRPSRMNDVKINVYKTRVSHSDKYAIKKDGKLFMLIGDSAMTIHVFTGEGLNIPFNLLRNIKNTNFEKIYNNRMNYQFKHNIKYKSLLKYMPHKVIKSICSQITKDDLENLLQEIRIYLKNNKLDYIFTNNNITKKELKNEICFILRDKLLKYYSYKID